MINISKKLDAKTWDTFNKNSPLGIRGNLELVKSLYLEDISQRDFSTKLAQSLYFQHGNLSYLEEFLLQDILSEAASYLTDPNFEGQILEKQSTQTESYVSSIDLALSFISSSATTLPVRFGNKSEVLIQTGRTLPLDDGTIALHYRHISEDDRPALTPDESVIYTGWVHPSDITEWWKETYIPTEDIINKYNNAYTPTGMRILARKDDDLLFSKHGQFLEVARISESPALSLKTFYLDTSEIRDPRRI